MEDPMIGKHGAANCQWAVPTLLQNPPHWLDAVDRPWTCVRDEAPHPLETTEICAECPRWKARPEPDGQGRRPTFS
jgi:hypothetical protein